MIQEVQILRDNLLAVFSVFFLLNILFCFRLVFYRRCQVLNSLSLHSCFFVHFSNVNHRSFRLLYFLYFSNLAFKIFVYSCECLNQNTNSFRKSHQFLLTFNVWLLRTFFCLLLKKQEYSFELVCFKSKNILFNRCLFAPIFLL